MLKPFKKNKDQEEKIPNPLRDSQEQSNEPDTSQEEQEEWIDEEYEEGQLSVDVYETENEIIIKSTIAGVKPEDLDISINNDMLTIRGERKQEENIDEEEYLYRECYWGAFSRSIILPAEVDTNSVEAELENGILTIILKKTAHPDEIPVKVKE